MSNPLEKLGSKPKKEASQREYKPRRCLQCELKDEQIILLTERSRIDKMCYLNYLKTYRRAYERVKDDPLSKTRMDYEEVLERLEGK